MLKKMVQLPPPCLGIEQVTHITALGVVVNDHMTTDHVTSLLISCTKLFYALRVLRALGLPQQSLMDVFHATVESKLHYAAPAWSGFCTAGDRERLINAFLCRCVKLGYRDNAAPSTEDIFGDCDDQLFSRINTNSLHILQQYLPDRSSLNYSLRPRRHNKTLIIKTSELNERDFIIRNIYKDIYWHL